MNEPHTAQGSTDQSPLRASLLERVFALRANDTTVRTEILGGTTTFVTMAYIIVVNPAILSFAGLPIGPSTVATILAAMFGTFLMAVYANRPIAVAPYMGENAFIAFALATIGVTWEQRLGAVFVAGVVFTVITVTGVRTWLAESISPTMRHSFAVGIGLFLALIGLYQSGVVTSGAAGMPVEALLTPDGQFLRAPEVPLKIGDLRAPNTLLSIFGFVVVTALLYYRVGGATLLGVALTAVVGWGVGLGAAPDAIFAVPFTGDYDVRAVALKLDVVGVLKLSFLPTLLTLVLMSFLDTLASLVAVGAAAGPAGTRQSLARLERPMLVDAASCMFSGLIGTSTSGAYIESATGIREGARTGLAALVTALLFGASLFFIPLVEPLQRLSYAYAPALVAVGVMMMTSAAHMDFDDLTELVPAFATIVLMVFTYNIGNGVTAGLVLYPLLKLLAGRGSELTWGSIVLGVVSASYFVFGLPH